MLFFLDEPCLGMVPCPSETPQKEMLAVLHDLLGRAPPPWRPARRAYLRQAVTGRVALTTLGQARPDIIALMPIRGWRCSAPTPLPRFFYAPAGWVACLVPTWPRLDQLDPQALFARWLVQAMA